jgi:hypothetical protein
VGEVFGEDRTFLPKSLPTFPPNNHICGTEQDHREGGEYLPALPPVTFREDGLPTCCGPLPVPPPPPPPPAGETCPTAEEVMAEETFEGVTGEVGTSHWVRVTGFIADRVYYCTFTNSSSSHVQLLSWISAVCPPPPETLIADTSIAFEGFLFSSFGGATGDRLFRFDSLTEGQSYTLRVWAL